MTEGKLVFLPKGYRVVPEEITDDIRQAAYRLEDSFPDGTNPTVTEYYNCFIEDAPQLTTPPVLRWEGDRLLVGVNDAAFIADIGDGFKYETCIGLMRGGFKKTEHEARRAAEKALGFPDGLVLEVV